MRYTEQLTILTQLLDESVSDQTTFAKEKYDIGKSAFDAALKAFPDDTLPHAHSLFAKVCVKMAMYEESLELFDEAIRRSSLPLEQAAAQGGNMASQEIMEAQYLIRQLMMERNRSNSMIYQSKVNAWDQATAQGIPLDTSPLVPLEFVKSLLKVFPAPHPQALFEQATLNVLALDTPKQEDADDNIKDDTEESSTSGQINENGNFFHAWETWDMYRQAQDSAFGAYTIGKQYTLAGGKRCNEKDDLLGIVDGGTEWSRVAHKSTPFAYNKDQYHGDGGSTTEDNDMYMGIITIDSAVVSGKDAVVSGYGDNCLVFVPHPYVNLANNLPMVSAWEAEAEELTMGPNPFVSTYQPENDMHAYNGKIGRDQFGKDDLLIPDPRPRSITEHFFSSAVLLTGYSSDNYYHFVAEVLPSLVSMRNHVRGVLKKQQKGKPRDVIIMPNLQHEFVEGFIRLLLPEAFEDEDKLSPQVIQWGLDRHPSDKVDEDAGIVKFNSRHPITYVQKLYTVAWDQPKQASPPVGGPAHCLTPSPLLGAMRRTVTKAVDESTDGSLFINNKLKIVYCSRSSSSTRRLKDEEELLTRMKEVASAMNAEVILFEKNIDDNSSSSTTPLGYIVDTINLFQSASVIVGIHGAALANIAFTRTGTTVIELGFEGLPQASHYRHMSSALGLNHVDVFLTKDARSLGAQEVALRDGGLDNVLSAVEEGLKRADHSDSAEDNGHSEL